MIFLDIENQINADIESCVAQKKSGIGGFFRNKNNQAAKCEATARLKYAPQIAEAQERERREEDLIFNEVNNTLTDKKTLVISGIVIIGIILMLLPKKA